MATNSIRSPEHCQTMSEVRAGVDAVDAALVELLSQRFGYMRAAARIKTERTAVRDEGRKAEVIANVATLAAAHGLPADRLTAIWETLVEQSIAYEFGEWDAGRS